MIKIGICGLSGRMGREIEKVLQNSNNAVLSGGYSSKIGFADDIFKNSDVVIDFSSPEGFFAASELAKKYNTPLVSGTTGFTKADEQKIQQIAKDIVVVISANMSYGVNLFFKFAKQMSSDLKNNKNYDIEIVETHHINKKDAPSGTAITLGKNVAKGLEKDFHKIAKFGRTEHDGIKLDGEIGFSSIRSGGIVGEHTLIFGSQDDRIELTHKAYNRAIFAKGSVDLAIMVYQKHKNGLQNGLYEYADFL